MKSYFSGEFIRFFNGLAKHNNKEWFEKNKENYIAYVKEPFSAFIEEMIVRMHFVDERINIEAKDAIFRIYRDVRFSKDKTPYKTHASALISPFGRKDLEMPGFYLELSHKEVGIYGGAYMIESKRLKKLRRYIVANRDEFSKLAREKNFVKHFGELRGDKAKRLDKEFLDALAKEPLLANKQFYYGKEFGAELLLDPKLPDILIKHIQAGLKMSRFLEEGLKG